MINLLPFIGQIPTFELTKTQWIILSMGIAGIVFAISVISSLIFLFASNKQSYLELVKANISVRLEDIDGFLHLVVNNSSNEVVTNLKISLSGKIIKKYLKNYGKNAKTLIKKICAVKTLGPLEKRSYKLFPMTDIILQKEIKKSKEGVRRDFNSESIRDGSVAVGAAKNDDDIEDTPFKAKILTKRNYINVKDKIRISYNYSCIGRKYYLSYKLTAIDVATLEEKEAYTKLILKEQHELLKQVVKQQNEIMATLKNGGSIDPTMPKFVPVQQLIVPTIEPIEEQSAIQETKEAINEEVSQKNADTIEGDEKNESIVESVAAKAAQINENEVEDFSYDEINRMLDTIRKQANIVDKRQQ